MSKFKEHKDINYAQLAEEVLSFWEAQNIFEKSVTEKEGKPTFTFFEGPPSANGTPGIHHVMGRTVKDVICRYKTLKGFQVKRKGGWDTHGLPVELQVEKELGITKEDIGKKISVKDYNQKCRESVMKFKGQWDDLTVKMGYWVDLQDPYITFDKKYIETLWHLLKELYKKDYLYKGYTIQPFSPAAGTGLSSHELNQPGTYRDVKDTSVVAQFKIKGTDNDYFLAWTTTPWTLPSNSALAVGEKISYVKVQTFNPYTHLPVNVILAKDLVGKFFSEKGAEAELDAYNAGDKVIPWRIIEEFKGADLVGKDYEQLMPYVQPEQPAFKVIPGDFVSTEDGTGIVHIAPTFGADDKRVADQAGIPAITVMEDGKEAPLVDKQGRFVDAVTDFAGQYVKEDYYTELPSADYKNIDIQIAIKLKEENKAFDVKKYEHSYPHCWRTDKPVLYYPLESWFIKTTAVKDRLVELNKTINWKPASTGSGRFGNWLENLVDWNLSRSRYWGTPLPIWRTEDGSEEICIGSIEELKQEVDKAIAAAIEQAPIGDDFDLHRPYVDEVFLISPSGKKMFREPDLIDVWFDSGAMPYAQWHYPFENDDIFKTNYPADFIAEGVDQTRGWFFTLHAIAVMLFDSVAFKNVIANGLVLDKDGEKMSKRKGNVIDPFETINTYGPDATRWYMISNAPPWDNLKFNLAGVAESQRRFFGTVLNTYNFFALYANLDSFTNNEAYTPVKDRTESDRWILSKLHSLIKKVEESYEDYDITRAARAIQDFAIDDLSNWYVRLNRKRFWKGEYNADKVAAYQTLLECLTTIAQLSSPIAPFYFDKLFNDINNVVGASEKDSVHLTDFPEANGAIIDIDLETRMDLAQRVSSLVHSLRKSKSLKVRQPLSKILIPVLNEKQKAQVAAVEELIKTEINVKEVEFIDNNSTVLVKKIKPNFRKLGQQFGPKMKLVAAAINQMTQEQISELEASNAYNIDLEGEPVTLSLEDVEIAFDDIPGWLVASEGGTTVALDITITEDLKKEGIARDLVNRIQNLRKDMGLDVQDKIKIQIEKKDDLINGAFETNRAYICTETQALELNLLDTLPDGNKIEMDDVELVLKIEA